MPLLGNTKTYGLTSVLKFLSDSRYSGRMRVYRNNKERVDIFLLNGNLRVPLDANWNPILTVEEFREKALASGDRPEQLQREVEEFIYEVFFWKRANYIFDRDFLPEKIEMPAEDDKWYLDLNTGSIVMEASRRADDIYRVQEDVPRQGRIFYTTSDDLADYPEEIIPYINGSRDVTQIIEASDTGLFKVSMTISKLLEENKAEILPPEQYTEQLKKFISEGDYQSAFHIYTHILNEDVGVEQSGTLLFGTSEIIEEENVHCISGEVSGPQALRIISALIHNEAAVEVTLQGETLDAVVHLGRSKVYFHQGDNFVKNTLEIMGRRGWISEEQSSMDPPEVLSQDDIQTSLPFSIPMPYLFVSVMAEALSELSLTEEIQLNSQPVGDDSSLKDSLVFDREDQTRDALVQLMEEWKNIVGEAPDDRSIVVLMRDARKTYVETEEEHFGSYLKHFHRNRRNLIEVRNAMSDTRTLFEFYFKVNTHLKLDQLRFLEIKELKELVTAEIMMENHSTAIGLIEAGKLADPDDMFFQEKLEELRLRSEGDIVAEDDRLVGDLTSFSLAEVLQNLVTNQLTGTLRIFVPEQPQAKRDIYFEKGNVYLLRKEEIASEKTVDMFLDMEAVEGLGSMSQEAEQTEDDLAQLAEITRQEIYELFLWEGATFTFILDALPPAFHNPPDNVIKLALDSQMFLMEAVNRLDLWYQISQIIPTEKTIFEFTSPEGKLQALATGKNPQVIYMIDGIHNTEDIIRISGMGKLESCSFLYDLYQMGLAQPLDVPKLILRGQEAYKAKNYPIALKYYECAVKMDPKDQRLQKIASGLHKLLDNNTGAG